MTAGVPSRALPAKGCMYFFHVRTAEATVMHADPPTQRSGSLNENSAELPLAMAAVAAVFQTLVSAESLLHSVGMYARFWL